MGKIHFMLDLSNHRKKLLSKPCSRVTEDVKICNTRIYSIEHIFWFDTFITTLSFIRAMKVSISTFV